MSKEKNEFDSLFEDDTVDDKSKEIKKLFTFDDQVQNRTDEGPSRPPPPAQPDPYKKKRSSEDFEPDMDALLITAQSPLITEGLRYLTIKDFSANTLQIYSEAVKGVELFIKILERNPNNYYKLEKIFSTDIDCKEIEAIALKLYKIKHHSNPQEAHQILKAYEMLRNRLMIGYNKALVNSSIGNIKKYFFLSGDLDKKKMIDFIKNNNNEILEDFTKFSQHLNIAIQLIRIGDFEISKGLRGRDINAFVIRASNFLTFYSSSTGDAKKEEYYRRMHENYKKYFITK